MIGDFFAAIGGRSTMLPSIGRAIDSQGNPIARALALDGDVVGDAAKFARGGEAWPRFGNHRGNLQAVVSDADAQNPLRDGVVIPRRGAGEPGVLGFAVGGRVLAGDHLRIDIRLAAVQVADLLARRGIDARVVIDARGRRCRAIVSAMMTHGLLWQKMPAFSL